MQAQRNGMPAHKAVSAWITAVVSVAGMAVAAPVMAQTAAGAARDGAPSEAARRAAESPYRFILQNAAIRERPKPAPAPAAAAAPVVEKEAPKRPAPVESVATVRQRAAQPAEPVAAQPEAVAPAPTPVAVAAPQAAPAPVVAVRKELIAVRQDPPELSAMLMRERPSGMVTVAFEVNPDGNVSGARVTKSSNSSLNRPSVSAVEKWKFQPIDDTRSLEIELNYSN
ncbi:MAG: TonB family protein [Pseudomonadota bacterium]